MLRLLQPVRVLSSRYGNRTKCKIVGIVNTAVKSMGVKFCFAMKVHIAKDEDDKTKPTCMTNIFLKKIAAYVCKPTI